MSEGEAHEVPPSKRDWGAVRAWANLFIAGATLLVAVVSIWLTTRVSGLEDYLRSEIALRNSELNTAANEAEALDERIRESTATLEDLRSTSDALTASSIIAQTKLAEAQNQSIALLTERNRTLAELTDSRQRLELVTKETEAQRAILERFREGEVLTRVSGLLFRVRFSDLFANDVNTRQVFDGPGAIRELASVGIDIGDPDTAHYYEKIRQTAPLICRSLETFKPKFPEQLPLPDLEPMRGERLSDGRIRTTNKEIEAYNARREEWRKEISRVYRFNDSIREARTAASEYLGNAMSHCACAALRGESSCEPMPVRPDLAKMLVQED